MAPRLSAEVALRHPARAVIARVVQEAPGQGFRELARRLGMAPGTLRHHLSVLIRSEVLRLELVGCRSAILPAGERRSPVVLSMLRDPELAALCDFVASRGQVIQRQIIQAFPAPRSTTGNRLKRLADAQALHARRDGRYMVYEAVNVLLLSAGIRRRSLSTPQGGDRP